MEFNGFRSISEYESECGRLGYITQRVPFHRDGAEYFALVTGLASQSSTSCQTWHLFTADESAEVLGGVILQHGADLREQLSAHGFTQESAQEIEQADQPERKIVMKKIGNFTSEAIDTPHG